MLKKKGQVVSTKMDKTAVVRVDARRSHPIYQKFYTISKKYFVHDPKEELQVGDRVEIVESRKIAKNKCWQISNIIKKA